MDRIGVFLIAGSAFLFFGRLSIHGHALTGWPGLYEASAHILVGALLTVAVLRPENRRETLWLLVVLSLFELLMFQTQNG